jgi:hypothetical protein
VQFIICNSVRYSLNSDLIQSECNHPDCTASFLQDYSKVDTGQCNNFLQLYKNGAIQRNLLYWSCIETAYGSASAMNNMGWGPQCYEDSDCTSFGVRCDLEKRACAVTRSWQQETFVRCMFDQISPFERNWIIQKYDLPSYDNSSFVPTLVTTSAGVSIYVFV